MDYELIDFNTTIDNNPKNNPKNNDSLDDYSKYDKITRETYCVMRKLKMDPITHEVVPEDLQFNFEYMWDPITGERTIKDKHGPLCFNVLSLAENFYHNRLRLLWYDGETIDGVKYEGYYGDGIGSGNDLYVNGRGDLRHMYLFRLPVIDCYLLENFSMSIITMGPKLTDDEITEIQNKIDRHYSKQTTPISKIKCNLLTMKTLYDIAIKKTNDINNKSEICAVNKLKLMKLY